jgi:hypothetical protein
MKRTDIRAGVVYAIKGSYGAPRPIVFLEDGAARLYGKGSYGRGGIRKLDESKYTKAKKGTGFSESDRGYAAIKVAWSSEISAAETAELMRAVDPAAELARFLADERPSAEGLGFDIVTSLSQIGGLYDEELAEYNARIAAKRAAERHLTDERTALAARVGAVVESLSAYGIRAKGAWEGKQVELSVDEAEKLITMLRDRES